MDEHEDRMSDTLVKIAEDSTRGTFFLTVGNTAAILISAAFVFIVAGILGPEQYGLYSVSIVVPSTMIHPHQEFLRSAYSSRALLNSLRSPTIDDQRIDDILK